MAPDHAFPWLAAIVLLPALGALAVAALARARDGVARWTATLFAGTALALVVWRLAAGGTGNSELHAWIPTLGVWLVLEMERAGGLLVAWVGLATVVTLAWTRPGPRGAALMLALQAAASGLFLARDVFLVLACIGAATAVVALVTSVPRNVLVFAAPGLVVLFGWFVRFFQMEYAQTGFASTDLERWRSLVLYPSEERVLFLWGALGIVLFLPAFAIAVENAPRPHRLALFASASMMGSYFVLRVLVPLCPRGAEASTTSVLAFAVLLMAWSGLARGWTLLAIGYQGLVLFGSFSVGETIVAPEIVMIAAAVGLFGLVLASATRLVWIFVALIVGFPLAAVVLPAWEAHGLSASWATIAFALMALACVRVARNPDPVGERR